MPFVRAAAWGDGEDEFDVAWVDLLMTGDADRPGKPACAQRLTELAAHAVPCVGKDCPEADAGGDQAIEFRQAQSPTWPAPSDIGRARRRARAELRRRSRSPAGTVADPLTGTSTRASVSDTKV